MPTFARFDNGVFAKTAEYETMPDPNPTKGFAWYPVGSRVEGDEAGWAVVDGEAIETYVPAPPPPPRRVGSTNEFAALFTAEEIAGIQAAVLTDADVRSWYFMGLGAVDISLDDERVGLALDMLVGKELLTAERKAEILDGAF